MTTTQARFIPADALPCNVCGWTGGDEGSDAHRVWHTAGPRLTITPMKNPYAMTTTYNVQVAGEITTCATVEEAQAVADRLIQELGAVQVAPMRIRKLEPVGRMAR